MTRPGHLKKGHILSRVPFLGRRMFPETKGIGEERVQSTIPTQLQNGLQRPQADLLAYFGSGDHHTCGPKQQNCPVNGYTSKERLAVQGGHAQLDVNGQICQTDLTRVRWNRPPGKELQHNSSSVNYSLGECSFVDHRHQTEPHPFLRKCALDSPTQFRGHGNCGVPVCAADQQSASVQEEQHASDFSNLNTSNGQGTLSRQVMQDLNGPSLVNEVMLPTKDVNVKKPTTNHLKCQEGDSSLQESGTFSSKHSERVIREQIQKVVVNLEDVLHGLKEIHLEMKEVVQKIDLLTADIEMGNEEPGDTFRRSRGAPPAYPTRDQGLDEVDQKLESNTQRSGTTSKRRSQKPPPYPYASTMGRVNSKDKSQKMPPYPFRRRLLSTIV